MAKKYISSVQSDHIVVDYGKKQLMMYFVNMEICSLDVDMKLPINANSELTLLDNGKKHKVIMDWQQSQQIIGKAEVPNR